MKKKFFGWENIKWVIKEFVAMYSNKPSYFSKKRFESSIAFLSAVGIILSYVYAHRATITNSEILADATLLFVIAGYTVVQIQKEKAIEPLVPNPKKEEPKVETPKEPDFSKDEDAV